ncbi:MAG TPA: TRIC cation channel family protein [Hanamia sp.]|jgi:uncharacterized membrane protein YeiH|nr:TRIC cation channel family protein [Hanamia sp.]
MNYLHSLYTFIDLAGTFAFSVSGAVAAKNKGIDIFGILVVAFTVACGPISDLPLFMTSKFQKF